MKELGIFLLNHWLLFLALVIVLTLIVMNTARFSLLGFKELQPADAVRLMNDRDVLVLDVREQDEFSSGHIIHARHVPVAQLTERVSELDAFRQQPVVVYCRTGQRAARAAALLKKQGFSEIYKLNGGIMSWQGAGLPLEKG
ncbi:MAG: rhodanese-like domain-containing protein [Gammaproteobacteria bacterium]|nr:rhodanese-like domain-containing protein [Gammaproteobacteria bacterium]